MRSFVLCSIFALSVSAATIEFNRNVRPILSDKCFACHGADAKAKNIPLRLDLEEAAKADLGGGRRAVVPGNPDGSELIRRITADKPARRMPPVSTGHVLAPKEIETLKNWIAQGAPWQAHWAFLPPKRAAVPAGNPIDYFIKNRLQQDGMQLSPEASKATLLRRVSLDLTGFPPTPSELDAFTKDALPGAYERVVDRLLASPRYGERMAIRWLDASRYADTNGYQFDGERQMWRWRDWVIASFNRNQRYDSFLIDQIAGDLLPNATMDQKIATAFNRNHRANTEDGIIPEEYAVEYVVDRLETTSTVFMGVTLGCARCHNHKYDPFTQKEFYQFFAYFNNVPELGRAMKYGNSPPLIPAPTMQQQTQMAALEARIADREKGFEKYAPQAAAFTKPGEYWHPVAGLEKVSEVKKNGTVEFDKGIIAKAAKLNGTNSLELEGAGLFDIEDRFTISAWIYSDTTPHGAILTRMADTERGKGYGIYADHGKLHFHITSNYADDAMRMETAAVLSAKRWHHVAISYSGSRMAEGVTIYLDGKPQEKKVLLDTLYRPFRNAGAIYKEPFRVGAGWGKQNYFHGLIDDARTYNRVVLADEVAAMVEPIRQGTNQARWYYFDNVAPEDVRDNWRHLTALRLEREQLERTFPTVMVMAESAKPKQTYLLLRGAYDKPGELVEPGVPAVLPPLPAGAPANRLTLAQWMVSPENPLVARVAVNRYWQMYFGAGLVKTTEDFGQQGDWPSHPELLDWLATDFVRTGWDVKAMQKLMVTSNTYRQSSKATQELMQKDPANRLLARGPRFRLPAEMVRDQALSASGLITERLGGPSVKPYQPAGLWKELIMQDMDYVQAKGPDLYRRSLYTFWKRTVAPPMMATFDAANREACVVRENRTNTPLQALNLMNDVTFLEAARFIGQRMITEGGKAADDRLAYGFKLLFTRSPAPAEMEILRNSLRFHLDYFSSKAESAASFAKLGDAPALNSIPPRDLAAYMAVASMMLNLDEAVTRE